MSMMKISRRVALERLSALLLGAALPPITLARKSEERLPAGYESEVLGGRPVAYWPLRSANGSITEDRGPHQYHGRIYGSPGFSPEGMTLDGRSYVEISHRPELSPTNNPAGFSVEAWLRPDTLVFPGETANPYIHWLGKGEKGNQEWAFRFYSQETERPNRISAYRWLAQGGLGSGAYVQDELTAGEWIHIVACFEPMAPDNPVAGVLIYKNGVLRGSPVTQKGSRYSSFGVRDTGGSAPLRLGTRDRISFLRGGLRDVAIYPRVLAAEEVESHYQQGVK